MAKIFKDRVLETTTTTGTGDVTLLGSVTGYTTLGLASGESFEYSMMAVDGVGAPTGEWETGVGTYVSAGVFSRAVAQSSNANALVNFSAGTKRVALTRIAAAQGGLIGMQVITATGAGTYTPTVGTTSIVIELVGGGGGGGGVAQPTGSNVNGASGGGGGGYLKKRLTANFAGASYVVGAGGTGGAAGNNNGTIGADTTFTATGGGTVYTAAGGGAGTAQTAGAAPKTFGAAGGGVATNGDLNVRGGNATRAALMATGAGFGSAGGTTVLSQYQVPATYFGTNSSSAGGNGLAYGGGGNGGVATGTGAAVAGGDGAAGVIIIHEYA